MTRTRTSLLAAATALAVTAGVSLSGPAHAGTAPARPLGTLVPLHAGALPLAKASVQSLNWSGYAVTAPAGHKITGVHSTFTVPAVRNITPGFAATWTGIGGYNTSDLIQAGVSENSPSALLGYNAWYEILPASETPVSGCSGDASCTVVPGDQMTVSITQQGTGTWAISIIDSGKWTFSKTLTYTSTYSSAEWILEAPTLVAAQTTLPLMDDTHFGSGDTYQLDGGGSQVISAGSPVTIDMSVGGIVPEATPSPLRSDGSSFTVCAYAATCP